MLIQILGTCPARQELPIYYTSYVLTGERDISSGLKAQARSGTDLHINNILSPYLFVSGIDSCNLPRICLTEYEYLYCPLTQDNLISGLSVHCIRQNTSCWPKLINLILDTQKYVTVP